MSKIYKLNYIVDNKIKKIYVCSNNKLTVKNGNLFDENNKEVFSNEQLKYIEEHNIPYEIIKINIYDDDTIQTIKEKMITNLTLDCSTFEIYLFATINKSINLKNIYDEITQDNLLELKKDILIQFLKNIRNNSYDFEEETIKLPEHDYYEYEHLMELNLQKKHNILTALGQVITLKKNYPFPINPYNNININEFLKREANNMLSTQNKYLLFTFGEIIDNNINFCLAKDVIGYSEEKLGDPLYLTELYYPLLINNNVKTLDALNSQGQALQDNDKKRMKKYYKKYNETIDFFFKLNKKTVENNVDYKNKGIKTIQFIIHPQIEIKLPLEIIFKIMNSTNDIPLIKYNPGNRIENIYRLYTGNNYSTNGSKIPQLYIDYGNKKIMINKLSRELSTRKKVGFYIKDDNIYTLCEFLENGNISVKLEMKKLISINEINTYLLDKLNNLLLINIKSYLEQSGYNYILFESLYENNIEIIDINYEIAIKNNIVINLKKYINCLSGIFNIHKSKLEKTNDIIEMTYKRVSSFQKMSSINAYITICRQNNMGTMEIIERLNENFNLGEKESKKYFTNWQQEVQLKQDTFESRKIKVESNPGFNVEIKNLLTTEKSIISSETNITISNINYIKYLFFIDVFMDSLLKIILNPDDADVKKICKGKKTIEVETIGEIKNKKEKEITEEINDSDDGIAMLFSDDDDDDDDEEEDENMVELKPNINTNEIIDKETSGLFDLSFLDTDDRALFDDEKFKDVDDEDGGDEDGDDEDVDDEDGNDEDVDDEDGDDEDGDDEDGDDEDGDDEDGDEKISFNLKNVQCNCHCSKKSNKTTDSPN
jgi:hypothetical protein